MKHICHLIISVFFLTLLAGSVQAQDHQGLYMKLDFLSVERHEINDFMDDIENVLKPVNQARIDAETLKYWYIYKVLYPGSRQTNHNFVTVSICSAICAFENIADHIGEVLSEAELENLLDRYNEIMTPKFAELWRINNSVLRNEDSKPSRYFMLDNMNVNPGSEYTYQMMEDENAKPIHEYRMENGNMEGWELYQLILPRGDEYGYNFATGNFYTHLRDLEFHFTEEIIRQSSPDVDVTAFIENVESIRDLVRSEVYELIDYAVVD